jgi:hypothetical protein
MQLSDGCEDKMADAIAKILPAGLESDPRPSAPKIYVNYLNANLSREARLEIANHPRIGKQNAHKGSRSMLEAEGSPSYSYFPSSDFGNDDSDSILGSTEPEEGDGDVDAEDCDQDAQEFDEHTEKEAGEPPRKRAAV